MYDEALKLKWNLDVINAMQHNNNTAIINK